MMNRNKPLKIVNTRTAVRCVIFPLNALEERKPEQLESDVLAVKPVNRRLPGTALLIDKLGKERQKEKEKRVAEKREKMSVGVDEEEVADAMSRIIADLT